MLLLHFSWEEVKKQQEGLRAGEERSWKESKKLLSII
jgi:hypothetical protein